MAPLINRMSRYFKNNHMGILLVRVGTGLVFFMHGWTKVHNLPGVMGMFVHFGFVGPVGIFIAWLELVGGLALILGVATRFFGAVFAIEMAVAFFITGGLTLGYPQHEMELLLFLLSVGIAVSGSGRYSLYAMECPECGAMSCDIHKK